MRFRPGHSGIELLVGLEGRDWTLLAAVLLLPWAFGGVEIWAYRTSGLLLTVSAALSFWADGWDGLGLDRHARWLLPAALLGVWAALQFVPLPAAVIRIVSPETAAIYQTTFPGYGRAAPDDLRVAIEDLALASVPEAADVPDPRPQRELPPFEVGGRWSGWRPLSLLPSMGQERLGWFVAMLLGFLVVRRRCREAAIAGAYRALLFVDVAALACFALIYAATANGKLYWVRQPLELSRPIGPYVNPNNLAAVMELVLPWVVAYGLHHWFRRTRRRGARAVPLAVATAGLCLLATIAAASKSSPFLELASLVILGLVAARGWRRKAAVVAIVGVVVAGLAVVVPYTHLGQRLGVFADVNAGGLGGVTRLPSGRAALAMLHDFPVVGVGIGAFRDVFPHYMPSGAQHRWSQLHDDWLEFAVEGGAVGLLLLAWLLVGFWGRLARSLARADGRSPDLQLLGMALGLAALSIHALFDFNHQIPANGLLFVFLGGMAVARAEALGPAADRAGRPRSGARHIVLALLAMLVVAAGVRAVHAWIAGPAYSNGKRLAAVGKYSEALQALESADVGGHGPAVLWLRGQVRLGLWQDRLVSGENIDRPDDLFVPAYREYTEAMSLSPASGWYRAGLGDLYRQVERLERWNLGTPLDALGGGPWMAVGRPGRVAVGLTRMAIQSEPETYTFYDQLAFTLLDYGEREAALAVVRRAAAVQPNWELHAFDNLDPAPDDLVDAFIESSRSVLGKTGFTTRAEQLLSLGQLEMERGDEHQAERDLREALAVPTHELVRVQARYVLGRVLEAQGRWADADAMYIEAAEHPNTEAAATAGRARVAEAEGRLDDALKLYREARRLRPRRMDWILANARVAEETGRNDQARQALSWAVQIASDDPAPLCMLIELNFKEKRLSDARHEIDRLQAIAPENPLLDRYRAQLLGSLD